MISFDISKIKLDRGQQIAVIIAGVTMPPFWFLYNFAPNIFFTTDVLKLLLLSISIGCGALLINVFVAMFLEGIVDYRADLKPLDAPHLHTLSVFASVLNFISFGLPSFIALTKKARHFTANEAMRYSVITYLWLVFIFFAFFLLIRFSIYLESKFSKKRVSNKDQISREDTQEPK